MLRLSGREDKEDICRRFGLVPEDVSDEKKGKVYQMKVKASGMTQVEELPCGENVYAIPTFNDALGAIMEEAYTIWVKKCPFCISRLK